MYVCTCMCMCSGHPVIIVFYFYNAAGQCEGHIEVHTVSSSLVWSVIKTNPYQLLSTFHQATPTPTTPASSNHYPHHVHIPFLLLHLLDFLPEPSSLHQPLLIDSFPPCYHPGAQTASVCGHQRCSAGSCSGSNSSYFFSCIFSFFSFFVFAFSFAFSFSFFFYFAFSFLYIFSFHSSFSL